MRALPPSPAAGSAFPSPIRQGSHRRNRDWRVASRDTRLGLAGTPGERREVTVVPARCVIPVDAEGVHVAAGGLREREPSGGGVTDVVEVDRLAFLGALDALDGDVEDTRDRDRPAHSALFDLDRLRLGAAEAADQWAQRS